MVLSSHVGAGIKSFGRTVSTLLTAEASFQPEKDTILKLHCHILDLRDGQGDLLCPLISFPGSMHEFIYYNLIFCGRIMPCNPSWPGTHCVQTDCP